MPRFPESEMLQENIPAWYKLGWDTQLPGFIFSIRKNVIPEMCRILVPSAPIIMVLQADEKLALDLYIPPTQDNWGFGGILELRGDDQDFISWQVKIPVIRSKSESGKDSYCQQIAFDIATSMNVLSMFLSCDIGIADQEGGEPQLLTYGLRTEITSFYGFSIWATFSKAMVDWLRTFGEEHQIDEINQIMLQAELTMYPNLDDDRLSTYGCDFSALYRPPCWINLSVPGNACGLDPNDYYDKDGGYRLSPHNTDAPVQQLTLLAGLAALCDMYRAAHPS